MLTWKTEKRKIKDLKLFDGNPRRMSDKQAEQRRLLTEEEAREYLLKNKKKKVCLNCGKIFIAKKDCKNRNQLYCSRKCYGQSIIGHSNTQKQLMVLGLGRKIKNNQNQEVKIKGKCLFCGREIIFPKSVNKKYCSKQCYWKNKEKKELLRCIICSKEFLREPSRKSKNNCCSKKCNYLFIRGENSHFWKGGITPQTHLRLLGAEWNKIRRLVYKRDNYICQKCGKTNVRLAAHHIVPYYISRNNDLSNLITLCQSCHMKEDLYFINSFTGQKAIKLN